MPHGARGYLCAPMLLSMTGFGRAEGYVRDKKVTVEVRSLNSKQLDLLVKLPVQWREKEPELRQLATTRVVRGKAELAISTEGASNGKRTTFNAGVVQAYYKELRELAAGLDPQASTDLLGVVLRMPDVVGTAREEADPADWPPIVALCGEAWSRFDAFRAAEGEKLGLELGGRVRNITALLSEVEAMDGGRVERTRARIQAKLEELGTKVDRDRLEQEMIYYLEKLDVTEEKLRLAAHCSYFIQTMEQEEGQGRKLGFIAQEMGREINTLGSKSNDAEMQQRVVLMKDELEKIKEQVLNVL